MIDQVCRTPTHRSVGCLVRPLINGVQDAGTLPYCPMSSFSVAVCSPHFDPLPSSSFQGWREQPQIRSLSKVGTRSRHGHVSTVSWRCRRVPSTPTIQPDWSNRLIRSFSRTTIIMPPKSNTASRKGPAFKPPRPVKDAAQGTTSAAAGKRAATAKTTRPAGVPKKATPARRAAAAQVIDSSDSEIEDLFSDLEADELMQNADKPEKPLPQPATQTEAIPEKLLGRLLQEGFEDPNTKIHRGAMDLTVKYMDLFVKEAISRAVMERNEAIKGNGPHQITDAFLQVEDLEKLTPQLVLDF